MKDFHVFFKDGKWHCHNTYFAVKSSGDTVKDACARASFLAWAAWFRAPIPPYAIIHGRNGV